MTRTRSTQPSPPTTTDGNSVSQFRQDTRGGPASQIDFANGMVILLVGVLFFFGASTVMLAGLSEAGPGDQLASWRAADKLSGDVFLENGTADTPHKDCIDAFFAQSPDPTCEHDNTWTGGSTEQDYLRSVLLLEANQRVAVDIVWADTGNTEHLGGNPPIDDIGQYQRRLPVDTGSGFRWATLKVYVW